MMSEDAVIDHDFLVDQLELLLWSTGDADVLIHAGGRLAHRFECPAPEARRLAEWLKNRRQPTLRELLAEHRRSLPREAVGAER
jgi:hypothetical protein